MTKGAAVNLTRKRKGMEMRKRDKKESEKASSEKEPTQEKKTKQWTESEHARYLEGLRKFGKNWDAVHGHLG